jgi:hypothetical protein
MVFGPGFIAIAETDLQIIEPALPIFVMFAAVQALYGFLVALIVDRLHPARLFAQDGGLLLRSAGSITW